MTSRIISTRVLAGDAAPSWTLVLRSTGAYEPYLRTYRGMVNSSRAAEFLLLDRLFPRSVFAALSRPRRAWPSWSADRARRGPDRRRRRGAPHRRPGPHDAGVHAAPPSCSPSCPPGSRAAGDDPRRRRGRVAAVLPRRAVGGVDRSRR